jgi:hypothetical protein
MKNITTKPACRLKLQLFGGFSGDANLSCCFLLGCRTEAILFAAVVTVGSYVWRRFVMIIGGALPFSLIAAHITAGAEKQQYLSLFAGAHAPLIRHDNYQLFCQQHHSAGISYFDGPEEGQHGVRGEEVCVGEGGACGFIPQ